MLTRAFFLKMLTSPWAITWALMALATVMAHLTIHPPIAQVGWEDWMVSLGLSALIWVASNVCRDLIPGELWQVAGAWVCAPLIAAGLIASLVLYGHLGEFLSWGMIHYALKSGGGTMSGFTTTYLGWGHWAGVGGLTVVLGLAWWKMPPMPMTTTTRWRALGAAIVTLCIGVAITFFSPNVKVITPDASLLVACVEAALEPGSEPLAQGPPLTPPQRQAPRPAPPDLFLIIHESLGTHDLPWYGGNPGAMPWLEGRIGQDAGSSWLVTSSAYTTSTTTHLSVPSIWSGIHPTRTLAARSQAPMLWQWAKAAGYQTVIVSSQCYAWGEFDAYIGRAKPDHLLGCDHHPDAPPVNDAGIDELLVTQGVEDLLKTLDPDKPLLLIYNSNALHPPFQTSSPLWQGEAPPGGETKYQKALKIVDQALRRLSTAADAARPGRDPVIVMTADHGERTDPVHRIPRVESYYEEFVRIPMIWRVPVALQTPALLQNVTGRNVSNLDLLPTLLEWMGHDPAAAPVALDGRGLSEEVLPEDRLLLVTNTTPARRWHHHGELLIQGTMRLIQGDLTGTELYDLRQGQTQRVQEELSRTKEGPQVIRALRARACERYGERSSICTAR